MLSGLVAQKHVGKWAPPDVALPNSELYRVLAGTGGHGAPWRDRERLRRVVAE